MRGHDVFLVRTLLCSVRTKQLPYFVIIIIIVILLKTIMIMIKIKSMNPKINFKCGSCFVLICVSF